VRTLVALVALVLASGALAAPPRQGILVPGRSLGGLGLGATPAEVRAAWGPVFGRCRACRAATWYFNLRPFQPEGAGVEFRRGRVVAVFTLWRPLGWRTSRGVSLGENAARVTAVYGPLPRASCGTYDALTLTRGQTVTSFYVLDEQLWGFGLSRRGLSACR
jgi:hypothetical protein